MRAANNLAILDATNSYAWCGEAVEVLECVGQALNKPAVDLKVVRIRGLLNAVRANLRAFKGAT